LLIRTNYHLINNPNFEKGIVKVQRGNEGNLTAAEASAIKRFQLPRAEDAEEDVAHADETDENFADTILNKRPKTSLSKYRSLKHLSATSNVCERLFSKAKRIMTDQRSSMHAGTLERLLFLYANASLWDVHLIDEMISRKEIIYKYGEQKDTAWTDADDVA